MVVVVLWLACICGEMASVTLHQIGVSELHAFFFLPSSLKEPKFIHSPVFESFVPLQCVPLLCEECMIDPKPMETALSCLLCPYSSFSPGRWFCLWPY